MLIYFSKLSGVFLFVFCLAPILATAKPLFKSKDRIVIGADGNYHSDSDIGSTAAILAMIASRGEQKRVVLYGYCNHIWDEKEYLKKKERRKSSTERMEEVVKKSIRLYGFDKKIFYNVHDEIHKSGCDDENNKAVEALIEEINDSSRRSRLWLLAAGPIEFFDLALRQAKPEKLKHVVLVSHKWSNNHHSQLHEATPWEYIKDKIMANGGEVHSGMEAEGDKVLEPEVKIPRDQRGITTKNPDAPFVGFSTTYLKTEKEIAKPWIWMKDHENSKIKYLWKAQKLGIIGDISDAGLIYYLFTGDDETSPEKFRTFIEKGLKK